MSILNSFKIWTLFQYFKDIILNEYIPQLIDSHQHSHQHKEAGWLVYRVQFLPWCKRYQVQDPDEPFFWNSQVALVVKNPPANAGDRETRVWSLGWRHPLEKDTATCFSILAWRIPWTEESGRLQSTGSQRIGHDWSDLAHINICPRE